MINLVEQKFILSTDIETIRRWAFPLHQFSLFSRHFLVLTAMFFARHSL